MDTDQTQFAEAEKHVRPFRDSLLEALKAELAFESDPDVQKEIRAEISRVKSEESSDAQ